MTDLFQGRKERLEAAIKKATASKKSANKFLKEAGIIDRNGKLASHLR
jgi:hypothetical protein